MVPPLFRVPPILSKPTPVLGGVCFGRRYPSLSRPVKDLLRLRWRDSRWKPRKLPFAAHRSGRSTPPIVVIEIRQNVRQAVVWRLPRQALWPSAHLVTAFSERACLGMLRVYSPTKSKRLHHQRECRRGLAAARVVEVIPRTRRTPIRENAHEPTLFHKSFHPIFRKI